MEKISGIVRGNSRVTTVDNKNTAPARTGMPTFGRPSGESTPVVAKTSSTPSRAVALHNGMTEAKKAVSQERMIAQMADEFFMSKARPEAPIQLEAEATEALAPEAIALEVEAPVSDYTPRGSYVDVHA